MANDLWYYEKDGEQHGPVTQAELQALIEIGELDRENLAWKPGERDWSETGTFEVLIPSFNTPPPVKKRATQQEAPAPPALPSRQTSESATGRTGAESTSRVEPETRQAPPAVAVATEVAPQELPPRSLPPESAPPPGVPPETVPTSGTPVEELLPETEFETSPDLPGGGAPPPAPPQAIPPQPIPPVIPPAPPAESTTTSMPAAGHQGIPPVSKTHGRFRILAEIVSFLVNLKRLFSWPPEKPAAQGAVLAVIVVAAALSWPWIPSDPDPVPTMLKGTRAPAGYIGPVGQIKIDAYPWAELTELTRSGKKVDVPGTLTTPLVLLVAPGSYRVELGDFMCEIDVAAESSRACKKVVRTVDAATYYQEVGW